MAAPSNVTIKDLSGKWTMNKKISDDSEKVLSFQKVGFATRKLIGNATITLHVQQYVDDNGITHIDIEQSAIGLKGTTEKRELNWEESSHSDYVFGKLDGRSRWINLDTVSQPLPDYEVTEKEASFLSQGWIEDDSENGGPNGERHIDSFVRNKDNKWTARQIWGFQIINGERRYVRKAVVKSIGGTDEYYLTLVYDRVA